MNKLYFQPLLSVLLFLMTSMAFAATVQLAQTAAKNSDRFLVLSDIHFDPFVLCHHMNARPCPLIVKLQQAPASAWPAILAEYDSAPAEYRADSTYLLFKSSLTAAKQAATAEQVKFILILGDFLGHDYRMYYKRYAQDKSVANFHAFVKKTMAFLTNEIATAFPDKDVYALIGNNDSDRGDYVTQLNGDFLKDTGVQWSRLIKDKTNRAMMLKTFPTAGYYAVNLPDQKKLRLIILNSVLFSYKAKGKGVNEAALRELDWMDKELQSVHDHHQKALILMHIPTGVDVYATLRLRLFTLIELWNPIYTKRYRELLQQYAPDITAIMAGHLHSDWLQILTFPDTNVEIPAIGTPSISPIFGNNPAFKIFSYSPTDMQIEDDVTYYYPISGDRKWDVEYDFR